MLGWITIKLNLKDKAYETLKEKSIALKKNVEPRGAYKVSRHGS